MWDFLCIENCLITPLLGHGLNISTTTFNFFAVAQFFDHNSRPRRHVPNMYYSYVWNFYEDYRIEAVAGHQKPLREHKNSKFILFGSEKRRVTQVDVLIKESLFHSTKKQWMRYLSQCKSPSKNIPFTKNVPHIKVLLPYVDPILHLLEFVQAMWRNFIIKKVWWWLYCIK